MPEQSIERKVAKGHEEVVGFWKRHVYQSLLYTGC